MRKRDIWMEIPLPMAASAWPLADATIAGHRGVALRGLALSMVAGTCGSAQPRIIPGHRK